MGDDLTELLETVRKIHGLLELLAEDKVAQRDAKQRATLRQIVGSSVKKQKSVLLMNGTLSQKQIHTKTGVHKGDLSTMVGKLREAGLLAGDTKTPNLSIRVRANFFESDERQAN